MISVRPGHCATRYCPPVLPVCFMSTFLNYFYRLPLEFVAQCFLLLSLVYLCVHRRFAGDRWFRCGIWIALIVWAAAVLWITALSRLPNPGYTPELIPFHSYREMFATGVSEIIRSNFMNVALFYPAGLLTASLFPKRWQHYHTIISVGILLALFSLSIEYIQFSFALGKPEIDDVIHNTIGAICGTIPFVFKDILHNPTI